MSDEVNLDAQLRTKALHDLRAHPTRLPHVVGVNVAQWLELQPGRNRSPEALDGRNMDARQWTLPLFYAVTAGGLFGVLASTTIGRGPVTRPHRRIFQCRVHPEHRAATLDLCSTRAWPSPQGVALGWLTDRRITITAEPPPVRPLLAIHSIVIIGVVTLTIAISALVWRTDAQRRAHNAVTSAVTRDGSSVDALLA